MMENKTEELQIFIKIEKGYPVQILKEDYTKLKDGGKFVIENLREDLYICNLDEDSLKPLVYFLMTGQKSKKWLKILLIIFAIIGIGGAILVLIYQGFLKEPEPIKTTNTTSSVFVPPSNIRPDIIEEVVETATGSQKTEDLLINAVSEVKKENADLQNKLATENRLYFCESENQRIKYDLEQKSFDFIKVENAMTTCKTKLDEQELKIADLEATPENQLYNSIGRDIYSFCEKPNLSPEKDETCKNLYINYIKKYGSE